MMREVQIYDTTLRDGNQAEEVSFSVEDKLRIARRLDEFGVAFIEGGWPNQTNPLDREFFERARDLEWTNARIAAFGSTRRGDVAPEDDDNLQQLVASSAPVVTIFGKSWTLHVTEVLRVSLEENLRMIEDSVAYLKEHADTVFFDAEQFFDGFNADREYALETLRAAARGGADLICVCDTNGGTLTWRLEEILATVRNEFQVPIGIHCHNDSGLAVANTLAAVNMGCTQVQGTINGYGERAGNANLCSIIPNLELKMGCRCLPEGKLPEITSVSHYVAELALIPHDHRQPYAGASAFAHKGGMHINAVLKTPVSFEHVPPETVGNERRLLLSDQAGRTTVYEKLQRLWPDLERDDPLVATVLAEVKTLEKNGYQFEAAEGSFELLARRLKGEAAKLFDLHGFRVMIEKHEQDADPYSEATIRIEVDGDMSHTAAEGTGPVHALDTALRKALLEKYPKLAQLHLTDYKVRVLDAKEGTATAVQVLIQTQDDADGAQWGTVAAHENIIEASWQALVDSIIYGLQRNGGDRPAQ